MKQLMNWRYVSAWRAYWLSVRAALFAGLLVAPVAHAAGVDDAGATEPGWRDRIQVHGFATQGFVHTTDNRFFGDSDTGSFDFTELGINLSYRATPALTLSGQVLSRRAGDMYNGSPVVDFALLDWNISNDEQLSYGVMLGRLKNTLGLYNDTRDVAFTRPSIFLPQQIYFDTVRNLVLSADGMQLYARFSTDAGNWLFNLGAGTNPVDKNVEISYLGADFGGSLDSEGVSLIARTEFETHDGAWRTALSAARATLDFSAGAGDPVGSGEIDFLYWVASLQYNAERWSLTAEYMQEPVDFAGFGPLLDWRDSTVQGYYLQGSYLLRSNVELVARYSEGFGDKDDRNGSKQSALSGGLAPPHSFYQKDLMLGVRWDVTPSFMLRAEHQWSQGTWTLSRRENPLPNAHVKDWNMFSLLASYRF